MEYYGPSTVFNSTPKFGKAAAVCELENIPCRLDPYTNTIHFKSTKAEEQFMIAWETAMSKAHSGAVTESQEAVAGLSSRATRPTEGQLRWD
jgi:hypothetical protein